MAYLVPRLFVAVLCLSPASFAQTASTAPPGSAPPGANTETGARPGNQIGTGMSLPMSDKSGNITPQDTASVLAARLPAPPVADNATPDEFLTAARNALAANMTGEAQEALERAETRDLTRSIPQSELGMPIHDPVVDRVSQVLRALGDGDQPGAQRQLEQMLAKPSG